MLGLGLYKFNVDAGLLNTSLRLANILPHNPSGCVARRSLTALEDRSSIPDASNNNLLVTKIRLANTGGISVLG